MPDPSAFDRVTMLARLENLSKGKGGIVKPSPNYKGYNVEIRPPKWEEKIWIGKHKTLERAHYVADAVYYYVGMPPFHFKEGVMRLPAITCIGTVIGTPVELPTHESCADYVSAIAKGEAFKPHRVDFKQQVKNVVKNPDFPFLTPPRTNGDDSDQEDEFVFDGDAEKALQMSSHSGSSGVPVAVVQTHVAGPDSVGGSEAVQAYVPSFDVDSNGSENILRSTRQSFDAVVYSLDDCPTTSSECKLWMKVIEELDKTSAGTSTPSVVFNDGEVCQDGYDTSPILNFPLIVRPFTSTSSGTQVELAAPARTALGSSSDWPSSQFATNAKRQRIGD